LTIFEKRVSKKEIPFFMKLMDQLNTYKINCPKPIKRKSGSYLINIKNKTACIVSFLNGRDKKSLNPKNCYEIGKMIAQMHLSTSKIKLYRKNSMGIKNLNPLLNSIKFKSKKFINLEKFLKNNFKDIKKKWPKKLPKGIIHGDLFIDNIFFKNNKLSGIIDFYFAANDYFMYEIAICVNALCFDKKASKFFLNKKNVKNLIKGYESVKKISIKEKKSLNILCRGAAMRYFLTRLFDYSNTPKSALIKIKDPREYYQKLVIHNNLNTYKDYLK
ncbi:homoserine kinase, partial [Candidatus Pelagibacter sp.]|nr:homoserine kinase [Candidatus Pelagibacter sp.]